MNHIRHQQNYFFFLCLTASLVLVYFIIRPFLMPLILAAVFAYLFQPVYRKISIYTRNHSGLAAIATAAAALVIFLIPLTFLATLILKEATGLYFSLAEDKGSFIEMATQTANRIGGILPLPENFQLDANQYVRQGLGFLASHLGTVFTSFAQALLDAFVFITAFYFLLKDGRQMKDRLIALSPLADRDDELIIARLGAAISSAVTGNLLIGLIQGALTGVGFAIFGVPNAALWGGVAAITALIPGIGTALVIAPAIIYLFFSGNSFGGTGLLVWGTLAVGMIDNFLGPRLVGRGMHMHSLAVFLAVLGGIAFFGPLGFLLGPLAMSVCFAFIEIYSLLKKREAAPENK